MGYPRTDLWSCVMLGSCLAPLMYDGSVSLDVRPRPRAVAWFLNLVPAGVVCRSHLGGELAGKQPCVRAGGWLRGLRPGQVHQGEGAVVELEEHFVAAPALRAGGWRLPARV